MFIKEKFIIKKVRNLYPRKVYDKNVRIFYQRNIYNKSERNDTIYNNVRIVVSNIEHSLI